MTDAESLGFGCAGGSEAAAHPSSPAEGILPDGAWRSHQVNRTAFQ